MRNLDSQSFETPGIDEDSPGQGIQEYVNALRKHWIVILLVVAVGVAGAVAYTLRQPKIYEAKASVVIDPQPPQVFGNQVQEVITLGTGSFWSNQEYYNTQVELLKSFDMAKRTIAENDLCREPGLSKGAEPPASDEDCVVAATTAFAAGLSASHNKDSRIVQIGVKLEDAELAVRLANLHVATFLEYTRGLRSGGTGEVSKFLAAELDTAEQRLRASERALLDFKKSNNLLSTSLEERQSILAKELARYSTALGDVRVKRTEQQTSLKRAKALLNEPVLDSPIFALVEATGVEELKEQYATEARKLRQLGQEYGPKHPEFQGQQKQVDAIVGSLEREARRAVRELDEKHQATLATERQFKAELEKLKQEAMDLEPKSVEYARLKRKQVSDAESYDMVLRRLRASDLTSRNEAINIRRHNRARTAALVSPRMSLNVAGAFVLSLMLGLGVALLIDFMDRTVKTADQVENMLGAPVLGVIPIIAEGSHSRANPVETKARDLHVHENPNSAAAECCRAIRTNILFAATDKRMKTLTVSSPRPKEGKSTTTIYLGTTMAQSGQKILLVDTDLRRPRLHKAMDVSRDKGLTTVLLGEATLDDSIKTTDVPNLYVLPAGPQPPNPGELLVTETFQRVLAELEERFDRILLDSPPLLAVSDAVVLSRLSDGVLLVLQAGQTSIDDATVAVRSLRGVDAPIVGAVLNDINLEDRRYGYGSKYYAYNYGEDSAAEA